MNLIIGLAWDWIALLIIVIGYIGYTLYRYFKTRKIITTLTESEFREGYRKAQLIDVREQKEYDAGHIWGARNIPVTQLKQRQKELRKDMPVYLYCQSGSRSSRAGWLLNKNGYQELYDLKGGFKQWTGKIKKTDKPKY
ncbi:rhodanese-like domain-containing protein [Amphibacillus cookii]|uniref:rhodanese-like domain-containing protein n=1 Tax=Amphibacillus cookii TaxID=767787 RepID=UPI0019596B67|nr:rhodanese-like domain-containing protein [Amphibacillus cookii]MBM7542420.1 rhodanese-related sulfurtransferase [Amphibacillus cookii]